MSGITFHHNEDDSDRIAAALRDDSRSARLDVPSGVRMNVQAVLRQEMKPRAASIGAIAPYLRIAAIFTVVAGIWIIAAPTQNHQQFPANIGNENASESSIVTKMLDGKIRELGLEEHLGPRTLDEARRLALKGDLMLRGFLARVPPSVRESRSDRR